MRTLKGAASLFGSWGGIAIIMAFVFLSTSLSDGLDLRSMLISAAFLVGGLTQLGYTRARLPVWAKKRAAQMEGLAERIPLLMRDDD